MNASLKNGRLLVSLLFGLSASMAPSIFIMYGIGQFNVLRLVGADNVISAFGISAGIVSASSIFLGPIGGYISDIKVISMFHRRFWILIGSVFGASSLVWFAYSSNIYQLVLSWICVSFFYGIVSTSYFALVPEKFNSAMRGKISGIIASVLPLLLMIFGMGVMGGLAAFSLSNKLISIIMIQLFFSLFSIFIIDESNEKRVVIRQSIFNFSVFRLYPSFKEFPDFTWVLINKMLFGFSVSGISMMSLFYVSRFHLSESKIFELTAISSAGTILMVVSGFFAVHFSEKYIKRKPFVIFSSLLISLVMFVYSFSGNLYLVIAASFLYQVCLGVYNATEAALMNIILPSAEHYGKDISIIKSASSIASMATNFMGPLLIGFGTKFLGGDGFDVYFFVLGLLILFSVLSIIPVRCVK